MIPLLAGSLALAQRPWDLQRFAQTAFFFNSPQEVLKRLPVPGRPAPALKDNVLWSKDVPLLEWGSLDDVVMGGVSESSFTSGRFSGLVSADNNGGFAGCRSKALSPPLQLSKYTGLQLRVRGDSATRRYKCIVRDSYDWNGIAWSQSFDALPSTAAGKWQEVRLPFQNFDPTLFARRIPGARLNTNAINTVQITYSKFEYDSELNPNWDEGRFELSIDSIAVY